MRKIDYNKLSSVIVDSELLKEGDTETFIHALSDISESFGRIYDKIIPAILSRSNNKEVLQDLLWDIREEFRHIEYHINDAKLNIL